MLINNSVRSLISDDSNYEFSYAGIGVAETPEFACSLFFEVAKVLSRKGCILRSGGDLGGDAAFESGALFKEIFLPYRSYNSNRSQIVGVDSKCLEIAKMHHPAWHRCSEFAKKYHARSVKIILGNELVDPVKALICWTPDGVIRQDAVSSKTGMSRVAILLALKNEIPILNIGNEIHMGILKRLLNNGSSVVSGSRSTTVLGGETKKRGFSNLK